MTLREYLKSRIEINKSKVQIYNKEDCPQITQVPLVILDAQFIRGRFGEARYLLNSLSDKILDTDIDDN